MTKYRLTDLQEKILRACYKKPIKSYCHYGRTIELDHVITPAAIRLLYGGSKKRSKTSIDASITRNIRNLFENELIDIYDGVTWALLEDEYLEGLLEKNLDMLNIRMGVGEHQVYYASSIAGKPRKTDFKRTIESRKRFLCEPKSKDLLGLGYVKEIRLTPTGLAKVEELFGTKKSGR